MRGCYGLYAHWTATAAVIPSQIDGWTVSSIGECAFQDCQFIEEFYSKSSVLKTIGDFAFENCKNLKNVLNQILEKKQEETLVDERQKTKKL